MLLLNEAALLSYLRETQGNKIIYYVNPFGKDPERVEKEVIKVTRWDGKRIYYTTLFKPTGDYIEHSYHLSDMFRNRPAKRAFTRGDEAEAYAASIRSKPILPEVLAHKKWHDAKIRRN